MDLVHDIKSKPWIGSKIIRLGRILKEREATLSETSALTDVDQDAREKFDKFIGENRREVDSYFQFNLTDEKHLKVETDCKLHMYDKQLEHARRMINDRAYKVDYLSTLKTTRAEVLMRHQASVIPNERTNTVVDDQALATTGELSAILVIQMWQQPKKGVMPKLEKEIEFSQDQSMTELRNYFQCPRDYEVPMDLSENPDQQADRVSRRELFKSGFFLIEDTFYNDLRDINNTDLSAPIISWASEEVTVVGEDGRNLRRDRGIGPFQTARMEETKFEDIAFRLGRPYLYKHQGNCEHLFVISDLRYIPRDDLLRKFKFPRVTATAIHRKEDSIRCYMCRNRPPHWYTRNSTRLPYDPFLFCENCFMSFNYDKNKRKIGQFQAYLYTSTSGIPDSLVMNK